MLVPRDDPTVLFTPAGMNQFKREFMGLGEPDFKRATTCQKCIRTGDIENVGKTGRHMTFFEMLGNFSFGDYFKREAIHWAWEFLTRTLKIPADRLTITVYLDDDEAYDIWHKEVKIPADRITRMGEDDNFWPAGAPTHGPNGVCGPCSEIFYHYEDGREVEIWNLVFTQFNRVGPNQLEPLPSKNIDTGMGLERAASCLQGVRTNFEIDIFTPLVAAVSDVLGQKYDAGSLDGIRMRRAADHARALTFTIHENVRPGPEKQGYVIRRLLRRAVLDAYQMGRREPYLHEIIPVVAEVMKRPYPELIDSVPRIRNVVKEEEEQLPPEPRERHDAARRHLPQDQGRRLQHDQRRRCLHPARDLRHPGRDRREPGRRPGPDGRPRGVRAEPRPARPDLPRQHRGRRRLLHRPARRPEAGVPRRVGLPRLRDDRGRGPGHRHPGPGQARRPRGGRRRPARRSPWSSTAPPSTASPAARSATPARSRAPASASGSIDTQRDRGFILHVGQLEEGTVSPGDSATARVDADRREAIRRAHSATHVLHHALHTHLGKHAQQAGSKVEPDRLRFDFANPEAVGRDRLRLIEETVNDRVLRGEPIRWRTMPLEEAKSLGAMALFGEKYPEVVRVVEMGEFSRELCGGTHLESVGRIGLFKVLGEESVAAGTRRITALTGKAAYEAIREEEDALARDRRRPEGPAPAGGSQRVAALLDEVKALKKQASQRREAPKVSADDLLGRGPSRSATRRSSPPRSTACTPDDLRQLIDVARRNAGGPVAALLITVSDGKVVLAAGLTDDLIERGLQAGKWVKEVASVVGGGGGGRPDFAQAGGKDPEKVPQAVEKALEVARAALGALI